MSSKIKPLDYSVLTICSLVISVICIVIGGLVLLGWWIDIEYLKSVVPSFVTMKVNTALCFIFIGCSLFLLHRNLTKHDKLWLAQIFAALAGSISLLTLLEIIFHWNLGIDELLLKQVPDNFVTGAPGRMAFATALTFFLISIALLLLGFEQWKAEAAAQIITLVTSIIPLISLICYLYNVEPIYEVTAFSSMAIHTALTAALMCLGVLFLRPTQGVMRVITSPYSGGSWCADCYQL